MARFSDHHPRPSTEIRIYQQTVDDLGKNTLTTEFFELFKKAMREGYAIRCSYGGNHNETLIQSEQHLKNYINDTQGAKMLN